MELVVDFVDCSQNSGTNKKALWNLLMEDFDDYLNIMNNWSYLGSMNRISAFTQFDYADVI